MADVEKHEFDSKTVLAARDRVQRHVRAVPSGDASAEKSERIKAWAERHPARVEMKRRLRDGAATRHIPVILLTARAQAHEVDSYMALGATGVIRKPFDPATLPDEVRRLVTQSG